MDGLWWRDWGWEEASACEWCVIEGRGELHASPGGDVAREELGRLQQLTARHIKSPRTSKMAGQMKGGSIHI